MAKCDQCGEEYEAKRSTSAYCSPKCKQAFYRNRMRNKPVTVTDENVTVTPTSVPSMGRAFTAVVALAPDGYPAQHHNPMMVGYVPLPKGE